MKDCTICKKWLKCTKKRKDVGYYCKSFKRVKSSKDKEDYSEDAFISDVANNAENFAENEGLSKKKIEKEVKEEVNLARNYLEVRNFKQSFEDALKSGTLNTEKTNSFFKEDIFPEAENFWEFCSDPQFLGVKLFPKQFAIFIDLFGEWCPKCSPKKHMLMNIEKNFPVDYNLANVYKDFVLMENGRCPKCKKSKSHFMRKGKLNQYTELAMVAGQRSGKSLMVSFAQAYLTHKYIMMGNPAKVFNVAQNVRFTGTMIAQTFQKATFQNLFSEYKQLLVNSPWFTDYHNFIKEEEKKFGMQVFKFNESAIAYNHK